MAGDSKTLKSAVSKFIPGEIQEKERIWVMCHLTTITVKLHTFVAYKIQNLGGCWDVVDIHLKLNQAIIFRHDLWHGGAKYDLQHFRLFRYYKAVNPGIDLYLATGKDGVTYHCWCKCKKGDACTCPARTVSARRVEYVPGMLGVQVWSVRTTSA